MESVMKKIFSGKSDEDVHRAFVKFGPGVFNDKYLIDAKRQKDKWAIKTSAEFANFLVKKCLTGVSGNLKIKGVIVSTFNLKDEVDFEIKKVKNFMGIKQIVIDSEIPVEKINDLMEKYPKAFFALSFDANGCKLKIKAKAPKSAKPSSKGEGKAKADFCSLKTDDRSIIEDLLFDHPDFKEISVNHSIEIKNIEIPKDESDPVKMRENAIRNGVVKRTVTLDGEEKVTEKEFSA